MDQEFLQFRLMFDQELRNLVLSPNHQSSSHRFHQPMLPWCWLTFEESRKSCYQLKDSEFVDPLAHLCHHHRQTNSNVRDAIRGRYAFRFPDVPPYRAVVSSNL